MVNSLPELTSANKTISPAISLAGKRCIMRFSVLLTFLLVLTTAFATDYRVADDFSIQFATAKAEGNFKGLEGTIHFTPEDLSSSSFNVWVDASTINTGNTTKDKHARGEKWLDVENHPRISFVSSSFQKTGDGYLVEGTISIRGVDKQLSIPFSFEDNVFQGTTAVLREDFGIEGPFLFGGLVGDEIAVRLRVPVAPVDSASGGER